MHVRPLALIAAATLAVVVLVAPSSASAEPSASATTPVERAGDAGGPSDLPTVLPSPRRIEPTGEPDLIYTSFAVDAGRGADPLAVQVVRNAFAQHGIRESSSRGTGTLRVLLRDAAEVVPTADLQQHGWTRADVDALGPEEYLLGSRPGPGGQTSVLVVGHDAGLFYGAQTLRQLVMEAVGGRLPSVTVEDGPGFPFRGGEESFYGPDWSHQDRLDQIDFLAQHKMNVFFYGPANDPRTTGRAWREPYGAEELARLQELVQYGRERHVEFLYRIGPAAPMHGGAAAGICHASQSDRDALLARLVQLRDIGVQRFVISWDDVTEQFTCPEDTARYGGLPEPVAAAQTEVLQDLQARFFAISPEVKPGITIPSAYWTNEPTAYRTAFDAALPDEWQIYWTGPGVMSPEIEGADAELAQQAFPRHELLVFDNYPVNDYDRSRLHLGPLENRSADLPGRVAGISWNEMSEQGASQVSLATAADYAWNPKAYDPERSWNIVLERLAGDEVGDMRVVADAFRYERFLAQPRQAPRMAELIDEYWSAYRSGGDLKAPAGALARHFEALVRADGPLAAALPEGLRADIAPWLEASSEGGHAGLRALALLDADAEGRTSDEATALEQLQASRARMAAIRATDPDGSTRPVTVALGTLIPFLDAVVAEAGRPDGGSLSVPYGERAVARAAATTVAVDVLAKAPGTYSGTLTATAPAGWSVSPASQQVSVRSDGRSVSTRFSVQVTAPSGATPDRLQFDLVGDGEGGSFAVGMYPATATADDYPTAVARTAPSAWWRFEEAAGGSLPDAVGDADGRLRGDSSLGAPGAADGSGALATAGGYAEVAAEVFDEPTGPFTVEAWVNSDEPPTGDGIGLVEKYAPPASDGFLLRLDGAGRPLFGTMDGQSLALTTGRTPLGIGEWHHVVGAFDGRELRVYADGVLMGSTATTVTPRVGARSLKLGARGDDRGQRLEGRLDEVALYDRALTSDEVAQHFLSWRP